MQAQKLTNRHGFFEGKIAVIGHLGGIYIRLKKYEIAINYINQYLSTYQEFSVFGRQLCALQDLSNFRLNIRDSNELVDLIQQQTEIYIDLADRNNELSDVNVLITVYDALEEWKIFMKFFEKCLSVREETISFHSQVNSLYESGITYKKNLGC